MNEYFQLAMAAMLPVAFSVILYLAEKETAFGKLNYWVRQSVFGIIFGAIAIIGTEFGISVLGVTMNVRDSAPVCAGLIFGAPAGIISGLIGGIERFFAASWGAGEYTKIACSVGTVFAGFFAAWLRKVLFDDKKPAWYYGLATGAIAEVVHMLMLFITHMNDADVSFALIQKCALPMISFCALSSMLATLTVGLIGREKLRLPREETKITQTFQRRLLVCVLVGFGITSVFTYFVQNSVSENKVESTLKMSLEDVKADVSEASDHNLMSLTRVIAKEVDALELIDSQALDTLSEMHELSEINVIDKEGIVCASTDPYNIGFNMSSGSQAKEFLVLLDGETNEFVQSYRSISRDRDVMRKYAGVALKNGGFVQLAYDSEDVHKDIAEQVINAVRNRHVGENGYMIICNENFDIISAPNDLSGQNLSATGIKTDDEEVGENTVFKANIYGEEVYCMYATTEGYYIIASMPQSEALFSRDSVLYFTIFMEVMIFTALFILIYFLIKNLVVDNIRKINSSLGEITDGNLDVTVDVRTNEEFASLSDDINTTVSALKHYIDEAAARIDKELEFARTIQHSALPTVFPPYPNRREFDIWAGMYTAKEVGGDFYDFYMLGEDKLAFLVADVSGKGIPAAMFMMTAKTLIKSFAESGAEVQDVFTMANEELCANNEAGMFVTAWMGVLNLKTGVVCFANAGHNPPLIRRADGSFEYLKLRAGFVLAGMEGVRYRKTELQLNPGDAIYLYTDGVTEATSSDKELYGEERLRDKLNSIKRIDVEDVCRSVKADVDAFVGEAPQFDDITMLCLAYHGEKGGSQMKEMTVAAKLENIEAVTDFVDKQLEALDCSPKAEMQINIAIDELFSNIARYAYNPEVGDATVRVEVSKNPLAVIITFIDKGVPYDPLTNKDPDITLSAEERQIGGLGIFMVKKTMDEINYEYKNGMNILTIKKKI